MFAYSLFVSSYIWLLVVLFFFGGRIPHPSIVPSFYQYIPLSFPIKKEKKEIYIEVPSEDSCFSNLMQSGVSFFNIKQRILSIMEKGSTERKRGPWAPLIRSILAYLTFKKWLTGDSNRCEMNPTRSIKKLNLKEIKITLTFILTGGPTKIQRQNTPPVPRKNRSTRDML